MPKEPGEQPREDEPKIEQISEAAAKEIEDLREHFAGFAKIGDIEEDIRQLQKSLADTRKRVEEGKESQGVINELREGVMPYEELRIKLAKAEIKRREIRGER